MYAYATAGFTSEEQYAEFDRLTSQPTMLPRQEAVTDIPKDIPGRRKIVRTLPKPDKAGLREMMRQLDKSGGQIQPKEAKRGGR